MTAPAAPAATPPHAPPTFTRAEREAMLAGVDDMIFKAMIARKVAVCEREDLAQDVRLELWKATDNFDPSRGAKWSTYVHTLINRVLNERFGRLCERAKIEVEFDPRFHARTVGPAELADPDDTVNDDAGGLFEQLHRAVNGALLSKRLATLTPGYRRLVEMVVVDRLTPDQIAAQTDQPRKSVLTNLQLAIKMLTGERVDCGREKRTRRRPTGEGLATVAG